MLWETSIDPSDPRTCFARLVKAWAEPENRVFVLRAGGPVSDVKDFYTRHLCEIGTAIPLAEDVSLGDRDNQRTGEIWMEVRYDPKHPDAYRHSANAQPLHTDGSYIPSFPNATLMICVANAGEGGETTFIKADDIVASLREDAPELLCKLSESAIRHARSGDERVEKVIDTSNDPVKVNWNFYCLAKDLESEERATSDRFFEHLSANPKIRESTMAVKLSPGDAITWKDREVLHGRNGFIATEESERFLWKCAIDVGQF